MSLGEFIRWCKCERMLLTTKQIRDNKSCFLCQKDHAQEFHKQFDINQVPESDWTK